MRDRVGGRGGGEQEEVERKSERTVRAEGSGGESKKESERWNQARDREVRDGERSDVTEPWRET